MPTRQSALIVWDSGERIWKQRLKPLVKKTKSTALKGVGLAEYKRKIYATTGFGGVFALDMTTGKKIWFYNAEMPIRIAPTVANDKVLIQTIDNTLIALNAASGEEEWRYKSAMEQTTLVGGASPAYDPAQDLIVAAFSNGELRAFKGSTGSPLWSDWLAAHARTNSLANINAIKQIRLSQEIWFLPQGIMTFWLRLTFVPAQEFGNGISAALTSLGLPEKCCSSYQPTTIYWPWKLKPERLCLGAPRFLLEHRLMTKPVSFFPDRFLQTTACS